MSSSCDPSSDETFKLVTNKKKLKRKSTKNSSKNSSDEQCSSMKRAAITQLQPVMLAAVNGDKPLASFSPIKIDRCLRNLIGQYDSCKPIRNGNLLVNCKTSNQIKTLLNLENLADANTKTSISVKSSIIIPAGAKGVIYNVPLDITNDDLLMCLKDDHVTYVKRFVKKSLVDLPPVLTDTKTVLLQFDSTALPLFVHIGYMRFSVKKYIPQPLRCFKCNRFGHVTANCRGKERCSKCGGEHKIENCQTSTVKCVNCNGNHTASSKECPRYQREVQVLKIKSDKNLTYAEAAQQYSTRATSRSKAIVTTSQYNTNLHADEFPPLPTSHVIPTNCPTTSKDRIVATNSPTLTTTHENNELQTQVMDEVDFSHNFMFGNPIYFLAFLTEVINRTILATKADKNINIYEIISESAGKRMGIPIDIEQLKSMI